jgi:hypothetical protein
MCPQDQRLEVFIIVRIGNMGNKKILRKWADSKDVGKRDRPGVSAAASPGSDGQRRRQPSRPNGQVGDSLTEGRFPVSFGQGELNPDPG